MMIDLRKLEKILPLVEKPGRYIGNEFSEWIRKSKKRG